MTQPAEATAPAAFAWCGSRVVAVIIDSIPVVLVFGGLAALYGEKETSHSSVSFYGGSHTSDNSVSFQLNGWPALAFILFTIAWLAYDLLYLQGTKGQSAGKWIMGIAVYQAGTAQPLGAGLTFARQLVHVADAAPCFIGFLWPLWDKENRTFADMIMTSRSYKVRPQIRAG